MQERNQEERQLLEPWEDPKWDEWCRTEPVTLVGRTILPMSARNIISMYPDLKDSEWWVNQKKDTFLSVFFSNPTDLGTTFQGRWIGMAVWRPGLFKRFHLSDVWEMLERFSNPMNGQQKNLLVALTTLSQVEMTPDRQPVSAEVLNVDELKEKPKLIDIAQEVSASELPFIKVTRKMPQLPFFIAHEEGSEGKEDFSGLHIHTLGLGKNDVCLALQLAGGQPTRTQAVQAALSCLDSCYDVDGLKITRRPEAAGPDKTKYRYPVAAIRSQKSKKRKKVDNLEGEATIDYNRCFRGVTTDGGHPRLYAVEHQKDWYIDVIGSRMGGNSGWWHDDFDAFVADFYPGVGIRYYDPYEDPSAKLIRGVSVQHIRALYPGPVKTLVQIDDAQSGDSHVAATWQLAPIYSSKKEGKYSFGIRECRHFSHCVPAEWTQSMSSCACLRCKATSNIAARYGGWPAYERIRAMLSRLGPVCEHSNYLAEEARQKEQQVMLPQRLAQFIANRTGEVYAYLSEFPLASYRRGPNPEFMVADSIRPLQEQGMPDYLISKSPGLAGYVLLFVDGEFYVYRREMEEIGPEVGLKF